MKRLMCNLAVGLMITACGGGGGGSDDSTPAEKKCWMASILATYFEKIPKSSFSCC